MGNTAATPRATDVSTKQQRIAKLAEQMSGKALTSLSHHIDGAWLLEAWRRTRKDGARGIDGQSAEQYAENLHGNLADLLDRAKRPLQSAAREASPHPERRWQEHTAHRHSDTRR